MRRRRGPCFAKRFLIFAIVSHVFIGALRPALAQSAATKSEAEYLVPPQGAGLEIPVHAQTVCILSFPEPLAPKALASSEDFDIKPWGGDGIAVRAINDKVTMATLALATKSGTIKVNVTLRVVPPAQPALTMVRFKPASMEEAFEARLAAELKKRIAPLEERLARERKELDGTIRRRAEGVMAERLLTRNEIVRLDSHGRNGDHVIAHVTRGLLLGDEGYLVFEIENRSASAYRLASVRVLADGRNVGGETRLASSAIERDAALIGVVAAGGTARGIVTVRSVNSVLNRPLVLELAMPDGRGAIRVDRGITLR